CTLGDDGLEILDSRRESTCELPALPKRMRELSHLDGIERLLQDQHPVRVSARLRDVLPAVIGIGRADHDTELRILLQQARGRLDAVEPRRHAYVDERDGVRPILPPCAAHALERLLALKRRIELEGLVDAHSVAAK